MTIKQFLLNNNVIPNRFRSKQDILTSWNLFHLEALSECVRLHTQEGFSAPQLKEAFNATTKLDFGEDKFRKLLRHWESDDNRKQLEDTILAKRGEESSEQTSEVGGGAEANEG